LKGALLGRTTKVTHSYSDECHMTSNRRELPTPAGHQEAQRTAMTQAILPYSEQLEEIALAAPQYAPTHTHNRRMASCSHCGTQLMPGSGEGWSISEDERVWPSGRTWYLCPACHKLEIYRAEFGPMIAVQLTIVRAWLEAHVEKSWVSSTMMTLNSIIGRAGDKGLDVAEYLAQNIGSLEANPTYQAVIAMAKQIACALCAGPVF
jgi:uncharacterized protein with PIN domain